MRKWPMTVSCCGPGDIFDQLKGRSQIMVNRAKGEQRSSAGGMQC